MDTKKIYKPLLEASTIVLTITLVWFAFIYYPKVINKYKTGIAGSSPKIVTNVIAKDEKFPIETSAYRLTYEQTSNTYYAFVSGDMLDTFELNRQTAKLALKTALSVDNLCNFNVIYVSENGIAVPQNLSANSDC